MKKIALFVFLAVLLVGLSSSFSWAACPQDSIDLGICDTLHFETWGHTDTCLEYCYGGICYLRCIKNPNSPFTRYLQVGLFVTHDLGTAQDSIPAFVLPFRFWAQPQASADSIIFPTADTLWHSYFDSDSTPVVLNNTYMGSDDTSTDGGIFRHMEPDSNRIQIIADMTPKWIIMGFDVCNQDSCFVSSSGKWYPRHVWLSLYSGASARSWWAGNKTLLATYTFKIFLKDGVDSTDICFDSTTWPPSSQLRFARYDGKAYVPRTNLRDPISGKSICFRVYRDTNMVRTVYTSVEEFSQLPDVPQEFALSQNYPNPFNPTTTIEFAITQPERVSLKIFNILGQKVETLLEDKRLDAGTYRITWKAKDYLPSGIYFYRIETDKRRMLTNRMVLLK